MSNFSPFQTIHPLIKKIIGCSLVTTLACILLKVFFVNALHLPPPATLLAISAWGAKHAAIYQVITYPFVNLIAFGSLSIWGLLGAFFQYYIIYSIGTAFIYQRGPKAFLTLFFGSSIITGLIGFILLALYPTPTTLLTGLSLPIMALLIWFAFHQPDAQIMLFIFPVRAKWAIFGLTTLYLFLDFSNGQFIHFTCTLTNALYAYLYACLSSESLGPFYRLHGLERQLIGLKRKMTSSQGASEGKIQDLYRTKTQIKKDLYLDLLLEKIAKEGKTSLSLKERWFLFRYSK